MGDIKKKKKKSILRDEGLWMDYQIVLLVTRLAAEEKRPRRRASNENSRQCQGLPGIRWSENSRLVGQV